MSDEMSKRIKEALGDGLGLIPQSLEAELMRICMAPSPSWSKYYVPPKLTRRERLSMNVHHVIWTLRYKVAHAIFPFSEGDFSEWDR
jgi:hypothetical protein